MTQPVPVLGSRGLVDHGVIRHFGGAVRKNWWMQPVSDGAGGRARARRGRGTFRP
jgi:hypothetical protein